MNFLRRALKISFFFLFAIFLQAEIFSNHAGPISRIQNRKEDSKIIVNNPGALAKDFLPLDCGWNYFRYSMVPPEDFYPVNRNRGGVLVRIPHSFKEESYYSTYHCQVQGLVPNMHYGMTIYGRVLSCSKIWCNGHLAAVSGFLNKDMFFSVPQQTSHIVDLPADASGVIDIVIHVADFSLDKGGIEKMLCITEKAHLEDVYRTHIALTIFLVAFFFTIASYNFILSFLNKKQITYFVLGLLCMFSIASVSTTGISVVNSLFPGIPFSVERRLYVVFFCFCVSLSVLYIGLLYKIPSKKMLLLYVLSFVISFASAVVPIRIFERLKLFFIVLQIVIHGVALVLPIKYILKKNSKSVKKVTSHMILYNVNTCVTILIVVLSFYDFVVARNKVSLTDTFFYYKLGVFFFGVLQCGTAGFRRDVANVRVKDYSDRLEYNNNSLAKFIPEQILKLMNAEDITKVIPGECHITDTMIVYAEIQHFKQLSESVEPEELFEIIQLYYHEIAPVVRSFGGYIVKYMYHGCLAIFPERNSDTIRCAIRMQQKMHDVRKELRRLHKTDISIGIAIHSGKIAGGVIGTERRLDTIAISQEINTAISIAMQTAKVNARILITEDAMPYCRAYAECMYDGHFVSFAGKQHLVYRAVPFVRQDNTYEELLDIVEDEHEN